MQVLAKYKARLSMQVGSSMLRSHAADIGLHPNMVTIAIMIPCKTHAIMRDHVMIVKFLPVNIRRQQSKIAIFAVEVDRKQKASTTNSLYKKLSATQLRSLVSYILGRYIPLENGESRMTEERPRYGVRTRILTLVILLLG